MYSFLDLNEVDVALEFLKEQEEGLFVQKLPILPGKKEARFAQLLGGELEIVEPTESQPVVISSGPSRNDRVSELEEEVAFLRAEVESLKSALAQFKEQFE